MPTNPIPYTKQSPRQREIGRLNDKWELLRKRNCSLYEEYRETSAELERMLTRINKLEKEEADDQTTE